jgi:hypothetical protein
MRRHSHGTATKKRVRTDGIIRAGSKETDRMGSEIQLALERWANSYLTMSAAAATLIGLLFVVITLAAGGQFVKDATERKTNIDVYLTPTGVYFSSVLGLAALLTFPDHTRFTAALCICVTGIVGLLYSASTLTGYGKGSHYRRRDVLPYKGLAVLAYVLVVVGGILLPHDSQRGLTCAAVGMLVLLATGIRNSWSMPTAIVVSTSAGPQ